MLREKYGCSLPERPLTLHKVVNNELTINKSLQMELSQLEDSRLLTDLLVMSVAPETQKKCSQETLSKNVEAYLLSSEKNEESTAQLLTLAHPFDILQCFHKVYNEYITLAKEKYNLGEEKKTFLLIPTRSKSKKKSVGEQVNVGSEGISQPQQNVKTSPRLSEKEATKHEVDTLRIADIQEANSNWQHMWDEFLNRYPYHQSSLMAVSEDLRESREEKEEVEDQVTEIIEKLRENKVVLDQATWARKGNIGDKVGNNGRIILSEEEKVALEAQTFLNEEYSRTLLESKDAQRRYSEYALKFNDLHKTVSRHFIEYVSTTYDDILILPPTEAYEEITKRRSAEIEKTSKSEEEEFHRLQNKYFKKQSGKPTKKCSPCDTKERQRQTNRKETN